MKTLLAVSGGIDSMCMADMYFRAGKDFAIAHCNFHLRGRESDGDAFFVENWAGTIGVRFFRADFDTSTYASEHGLSIEMAARELRYEWFSELASEEGFDAVATAHNANDNAETLILNLLRGTGQKGLCGMAASSFLPYSDGRILLLRPLLGMTRREIEEYASANGVIHREDRTNAENEYRRNRIRNEVFPIFESINPSFIQTLNADMERFSQTGDVAEDCFREVEKEIMEDDTIMVAALLERKHWKYFLYRILDPYGFTPSTISSISQLLEGMKSGKVLTFSGKRFLSPTHMLETSAGAMKISVRKAPDSPEEDSLTVHGPGTYSFNGIGILVEKTRLDSEASLKQPRGMLVCDPEVLAFPFLLRKWKPGDWMRPFGMGGRSKKLSDMFTDLKFSLLEKESAIILTSPSLDREDGSHVAALVGHRMDEALRVREGFKGDVIRISLI